ncbi:probable polygalacturonase, partial [Tanacetum coccineum]
MGFLMLVFLSFCYVSFGPTTASAYVYDVTSFGAIGDGMKDDTKAFLQAWNSLCNDKSPYPTLHIPPGKTFLISPVAFNGPCKYSSVYIMLYGNITAPKTPGGWENCISKRFWIEFSMVQSLTINGPGQFDGQGRIWWGNKALSEKCDRPTALHFHACNGLRLNGTTHINSPFLHISIVNCVDVNIGNLQIRAPGDSPNTDGIDLSASSRINIYDSNIQT